MSNNILEALGGAGGIAQIAQQLGIDQQTAATGAAALLPAILGGFKKQAQTQPEGLGGLAGLLGGLGGGNLLDSILTPGATSPAQGNEILGQIFGSKDVSRQVANSAASNSGLSPDLLKQLLPLVAMAAAGMMSKSASAAPAGGGLGGLIGGLLGGGQQAQTQQGGLGGLMGMLDLDGDGNPLDDILGMAQKLGR